MAIQRQDSGIGRTKRNESDCDNLRGLTGPEGLNWNPHIQDMNNGLHGIIGLGYISPACYK